MATRFSQTNSNAFLVKRLPTLVPVEELYKLFSGYGSVYSIEVKPDQRSSIMGLFFAKVILSHNTDLTPIIRDFSTNGTLSHYNYGIEVLYPYTINESRPDTYLNNLFIENIPMSFTKELFDVSLTEVLGSFKSSRLNCAMDGTCKGHGFVSFNTLAEAMVAIEKLREASFGAGKLQVKVQPSTTRPSIPIRPANLYIKHIPDSIDSTEKLRQLFSPFGVITSCLLKTNAHGVSLGYGYVAFSDHYSAERARVALGGQVIGQPPKQLFVAFHEDRRERDSKLRTWFGGNHNVAVTQNEQIVFDHKVINAPKAQDDVINGIDFNALREASVETRKEVLGNYLYPIVEKKYPENAPKITGAILHQLTMEELKRMVADDLYRNTTIEEANNAVANSV
ncbi:hypothetical protein RCL1_007866 [Eukaryota sp. TZLM3-RCL]